MQILNLRTFAHIPSPSDIQKKLRSLLPPDYAKDHKTFRPSDRISMRRRLDNTRRCRNGRISKQRKRGGGLCRRNSSKDVETRSIDLFEGPLNAFKDYRTDWSDQSQSNATANVWQLTGSELVFPRRILLDGSSVQANNENRLHEAFDNSNKEGMLHSVPTVDRLAKSSASSIRSLNQRLAHKYSGSYLSHIGSVLRHSSSISWRSSFSSNISLSNSENSGHVSIQGSNGELTGSEQRIWNELVQVVTFGKSLSLKPRYPPQLRSCCSMRDSLIPSTIDSATCLQCGYHDGHFNAIRKHWASIALSNSGFISFQPGAEASYSLVALTDVDFYDNTLLHHVVSHVPSFIMIRTIILKGGNVTIRNTAGETFLHLLCRRKFNYISEIHQEFIQTIELLKLKNFNFSEQDHHGSTVLHILFRRSHGQEFNFLSIRKFLEIIHLDLDALDCFGLSILDYLEKWYKKSRTERDINSWKNMRAKFIRNSKVSICDCPAFLLLNDNYDLARKWRIRLNRHSRRGSCLYDCKPRDRCEGCPECSSYLDSNSYMKRIDSDGDGPILSFIKKWNRATSEACDCSVLVEVIERMVTGGAEVQQKDRQGDTALAVAAGRGMRQVVIFLIKKKANVNSRNNNKKAVLAQAQKHLFEAKDSDDEILHAAIWSCCMVLIDAGAKIEPTTQEEWISERGRSELAKLVNSPKEEPKQGSTR